MAGTKRKRRSVGIAVSKMEKGKGAGLLELFSGRCQMIVSSFYHDVSDPRLQEGAKNFFADYKKLVPKEKFVEDFGVSLEVAAECALEERRLDLERMERAEEEVAKWLKKELGLPRRPRSLGQWRRYGRT